MCFCEVCVCVQQTMQLCCDIMAAIERNKNAMPELLDGVSCATLKDVSTGLDHHSAAWKMSNAAKAVSKQHMGRFEEFKLVASHA